MTLRDWLLLIFGACGGWALACVAWIVVQDYPYRRRQG